MKKLLTILFLLIPCVSYAAGTVTQSTTIRGSVALGTYEKRVTITWTADAADGTVPSTQLTEAIDGFVYLGETDPGATAPTDLYDITLLDENSSADIFGGELGDRSTSASEQAMPKIGATYGPRPVTGKPTFTLSNNSVNSATGILILTIRDH